MIVLFIRHADRVDDKLTRLGRKQCKMLLKTSEKYNYHKIYCSTTERCKETARLFNKKMNLEIAYEPSLIDRDNLEREPQTKEEQLWYDNYLNPKFSSKNPEGCKEFLKRNFEVFNRIIEEHFDRNENIIIVAHSCTFYALMAYLYGTSGDKIQWLRLGNASKVYLEINSRRKDAKDIF